MGFNYDGVNDETGTRYDKEGYNIVGFNRGDNNSQEYKSRGLERDEISQKIGMIISAWLML